MINEDLKQAVIRDIVLFKSGGHQGRSGSRRRSGDRGTLKEDGKESKFIKGLCARQIKRRWRQFRWSSAESSIKNLVTLLKNAGGKGVGMSGMDGGLFEAVKLNDPDGTEYGYGVISLRQTRRLFSICWKKAISR